MALAVSLAGAAWAGGGSKDSGPNEGRLLVRERVVKDAKRVDDVSVFRVHKLASGEVVLSERFRGRIELDRFLPARRYRLTSFVRRCRNDCSNLAEPRDRCEARLRMFGDIDRVTVVRDEGNPCQIRIRGHFCPSTELDAFNARRLIGLSVPEARPRGRRHGCIVRVVRRNGEALLITDDHRNDRINVAVEDRVIVRIAGVW